jgi:hypothetical protein
VLHKNIREIWKGENKDLRVVSSLTDYVAKILPLPIAKAKNGDTEFWKEKFHAAIGRLS